MKTSELYARIPQKLIRRAVKGQFERLSITTAKLRRLLKSDIDRELKCKIYGFLLNRRRRG